LIKLFVGGERSAPFLSLIYHFCVEPKLKRAVGDAPFESIDYGVT